LKEIEKLEMRNTSDYTVKKYICMKEENGEKRKMVYTVNKWLNQNIWTEN
jgi:hypothetical protein